MEKLSKILFLLLLTSCANYTYRGGLFHYDINARVQACIEENVFLGAKFTDASITCFKLHKGE